eukprot:Platyproteum_vivax@DN12333_c0_g1_i1.p1
MDNEFDQMRRRMLAMQRDMSRMMSTFPEGGFLVDDFMTPFPQLGGGAEMPPMVMDDTHHNQQQLARQSPAAVQFIPRMDIRETDKAVVLHADLPGMSKDDIKIDISENKLKLSGQRSKEECHQGGNWYTQERHFGSFSRVFRLPHGVQQDQIKAKFENGVLEVEVPKAAPSSTTSISIQ